MAGTKRKDSGLSGSATGSSKRVKPSPSSKTKPTSQTSSKSKSSAKSKAKPARVETSFEALPWTAIDAALTIPGEDGVMDLEEVEGVEIVYENGKPVFKVKEAGPKAQAKVQEHVVDGPLPRAPTPPPEMSAWTEMGLHPLLVGSLPSPTPTPIQSAVLPLVLGASKDILGTAPTGSGKTLAFALPILHSLLTERPAAYTAQALILLPTRELAMQVVAHMRAVLALVNANGKPVVSVTPIVGGMSAQKQERVLTRGVHVVVATPGRLWDVLQTSGELREQLGAGLRYLVLDEADRMVQPGSFSELERILEVVYGGKLEEDAEQEVQVDMEEGNKETHGPRQTFVFSATMSSAWLRRTKNKGKKGKRSTAEGGDNMLPNLTELLPGFDPVVFNLSSADAESPESDEKPSPSQRLPPTLRSLLLPVLSATRDLTLYTLLLLHPAPTIVFLPSITHIRRLLPLLRLLLPGRDVLPLHSQLPQGTRMSSIDTFRDSSADVKGKGKKSKKKNPLLLSTDLSSRGLDLPSVALVVSYTPAPSPATHLHRLGRTARAGREGTAITMVSPQDDVTARGIWRVFGEPDRYEDVGEGSGMNSVLEKARGRVQLAKEIEDREHKTRRDKHDGKWMKEAAEALGVEWDEDEGSGRKGENDEVKQAGGKDPQLLAMKARLKGMLAQPLVPRGISTRYPTAKLAQDVLSGRVVDGVVGARTGSLVPATVKVDDDDEEWGGIEA